MMFDFDKKLVEILRLDWPTGECGNGLGFDFKLHFAHGSQEVEARTLLQVVKLDVPPALTEVRCDAQLVLQRPQAFLEALSETTKKSCFGWRGKGRYCLTHTQ